jgi:chromosome segregation ATPase
MTPHDPLREVIRDQAKHLTQRRDWLQKMVERQTQTILNTQESVTHFSQELAAVETQLESLREQYRDRFNGDDQ